MKQNIKKLLLICICTVLINAQMSSAKTIKINVGQTKQLKAFGNKSVKWKVKSGKSVSVNKKGVIKGLKKGKSKIIAYKNGKSKAISVKVSNVYYKCDFSWVDSIKIRNLDNGNEKIVAQDEVSKIEQSLSEQSLYRITKDPYKKVVGGGYMLYLYDINGIKKGVMCISSDIIKVYNDDASIAKGNPDIYRSDSGNINLDILE